jgi:hypothetical protein
VLHARGHVQLDQAGGIDAEPLADRSGQRGVAPGGGGLVVFGDQRQRAADRLVQVSAAVKIVERLAAQVGQLSEQPQLPVAQVPPGARARPQVAAVADGAAHDRHGHAGIRVPPRAVVGDQLQAPAGLARGDPPPDQRLVQAVGGDRHELVRRARVAQQQAGLGRADHPAGLHHQARQQQRGVAVDRRGVGLAPRHEAPGLRARACAPHDEREHDDVEGEPEGERDEEGGGHAVPCHSGCSHWKRRIPMCWTDVLGAGALVASVCLPERCGAKPSRP